MQEEESTAERVLLLKAQIAANSDDDVLVALHKLNSNNATRRWLSGQVREVEFVLRRGGHGTSMKD